MTKINVTSVHENNIRLEKEISENREGKIADKKKVRKPFLKRLG